MQFNHPVWEIISMIDGFRMYQKHQEEKEKRKKREEMKHQMNILFKQVSRLRKRYRKTYNSEHLKCLKDKEVEYQDVFVQYWYY